MELANINHTFRKLLPYTLMQYSYITSRIKSELVRSGSLQAQANDALSFGNDCNSDSADWRLLNNNVYLMVVTPN